MGGSAVGSADGGDVLVVSSDGHFYITCIGKGVIGGIEADPAYHREKDLRPCMGGLGANKMIPRTVIEVAGCVARRNPSRTAKSQHHVGEILTNATFLRETLIEMRGDIGAAGFVTELRVNPIHDPGRLIEICIVAEGDVYGLAPDFWAENDTRALVQIRPAAIAHRGGSVNFFGCGARFVRYFERQVVDAYPALDFEMLVGSLNFEVMGRVLKEILEFAHARGWQHANQRGERFLKGKGARLKV